MYKIEFTLDKNNIILGEMYATHKEGAISEDDHLIVKFGSYLSFYQITEKKTPTSKRSESRG